MPLTIPLTILLATAGLAALAFTLLYLHAAGARRDDLTAFYLADAPDDEADTKPLLVTLDLPSVDALRANLGERRL